MKVYKKLTTKVGFLLISGGAGCIDTNKKRSSRQLPHVI